MAIIVYAELSREMQTETDPPPAVPSAGAMPGTAAKGPQSEIVYDTIGLKFMDATYVAWLFGKAELPKGFVMPFAAVGDRTPASETTENRGSGGALVDFLPEGIELLAPVAYGSQQLVVAGTAQAAAELRELIGMIDRKPQQVVVEYRYFSGLPANLDRSELRAVQSGEHSLSVMPWADDWDEARPPAGVEPGSCRVATMNLMPAIVVVPSADSSGQILLVVTPRINGDGTVTVYAEVQEIKNRGLGGDGDASVVTTTRRTQSAVNVRDGESFGLMVSVGGEWETVIVTPRIVREGRTEG